MLYIYIYCIKILNIYIHVIMKTMCPFCYHHIIFMATHVPGTHDVRLKHETTVHNEPKCMNCYKLL